MKIKAFKILSLIFFISFTISCEKDNLLPNSEDKILGKWNYYKVTFTEGFFKTKDISSEYSNIKVEFFKNKTFIQTDTQNNEKLFGTWNIYTDTVYSDDGYDIIEYLKGNLHDTINAVSYDVFWDYLDVSRTKINYQEETNEGTYKYKLNRILDGKRNNM